MSVMILPMFAAMIVPAAITSLIQLISTERLVTTTVVSTMIVISTELLAFARIPLFSAIATPIILLVITPTTMITATIVPATFAAS